MELRSPTAAREQEPANLLVPRNGRRIVKGGVKGRSRADTSLGLARRADPTLSSGRGSLHYRLKEHVSRRRISGTMPEVIDKSIEGAVNSRKDDVRGKSAQETRGLGQQ